MKQNTYIKQTKRILGTALFILLSSCNMENGIHKSLNFLYGETSSKSLEEMQAEYEQSHNFEAVTKGNKVNGNNFVYLYTLLKNPNPDKKNKEEIAKTLVSYLETPGDEFDRHAKLDLLSSDVNSALDAAKSLIEEGDFTVKFSRSIQLGEYDFERGGFPIRNKLVNYEVKISPQFSSAALDKSRILVSGENFAGYNATKRMRAAIVFDLSDEKKNFIPVSQNNARAFKETFSQQGSFMTLYAKATGATQMSLGGPNPLDKLASPIPGSAGIRLGPGNMPAIEMTVYRIALFKMENKTAIRIGETKPYKS